MLKRLVVLFSLAWFATRQTPIPALYVSGLSKVPIRLFVLSTGLQRPSSKHGSALRATRRRLRP